MLSVARQVVPGWRHLRALDFLTPKAVRRIVERALAVGLGASFGLSGVHAIGAATVPVRPRVDVPVVRSAPPAIRSPEPSPRASGGATPHDPGVVVRAGDNLWVIAKRALEGEHLAAGSNEIAAYWRRVIAANAGGLRSHDPNLIFPGEHIVLPPLPGPDPTAG